MMIRLNDKIIAYFDINNIDHIPNIDYMVEINKEKIDEITLWNTNKLGAIPTDEQLNSAYSTYQANIAAAEQAKADLKASAHGKLASLGLTEDEIKAITRG